MKSSWAGSWSRRFLTGFVLASSMSSFTPIAHAATASVRWLPRGGPAASYAVYVRNAGSTYAEGPQWTGNPAPAADGTITVAVPYVVAPSGTNYFTVTALSASGESALATELPIGNVDRCHNDICVTKTGCDFSSQPDGTSCDDDVYCNGAEVCVGGVCDTSSIRDCADSIECTVDSCAEAEGRCTHSGPPGCCLACDSNDPCLVDACAEGDCTAAEGTPIEVNRIRLIHKASGIKLAAKGSFYVDPSIDPTVTGVVLEMRAPDGSVLYTSSISADSMKAGSSLGRYRFTASKVQSDFFVHGLTSLDFRVKRGKWVVTVKAETADLMDTFLEPTISWTIRMADTCVRKIDMPCSQGPSVSVCR